MGRLLYLYAIVEAGAAHRLLQEGAVPGIDPARPLCAIEADGLVAAVSRVPASTFDEEPLNALLADLPRLTPFVVRHEEAVRALLPAARALVPMAFGAVYRTPAAVRDMLRGRAEELRRLLDAVRDRQEWGLKAFADTPVLLAAAERASTELNRLAAEAAAATPGRAYLLRRQRERLLAGQADRLARETLSAVVDRLAAISAAVRREELPAGQEGAVPLVLKAAFLVDVATGDAFAAAVTELEQICAPLGFRLDRSGPWAPYSFVGGGRDAT